MESIPYRTGQNGTVDQGNLFCSSLDCGYYDCLIPNDHICTFNRRLVVGVRENKVETHLDNEITKLGGITRKWVSPGIDGVPDRIVIIHGMIYFVEVKTVDGKLSSAQLKEQDRLKMNGAKVRTVFGQSSVDQFIKELRL